MASLRAPTAFTLRRTSSLALAALLAACEGPMASNVAPDLAASEDALESGNGLTPNGISNNGISNNGISNNGLVLGAAGNGLAERGLWNGVWTPEFLSWFRTDTAYGDMVMRYVTRCALGQWDSVYFRDGVSGVEYRWYGKLGLARSWGMLPASEYEQQIVTACMAALTNRYGRTTEVSLQGRGSDLLLIPLEWNELATYSFREGCFFGNLFKGQGVYAGLDHGPIHASTSSVRACALDPSANGTSTTCAPILQLGSCSALCAKRDTSSYETCTHGGRTYPAITTRLAASLLSTCGDGICQVSEKCGTTTSAKACADCGVCR